MGLHAEEPEIANNTGLGDVRLGGTRAHAPVRRAVGMAGVQRGVDQARYLKVKRTRPELPVLIYTGYEDQVTRVLELRRQTGLANLTVLHKGPDIDAFVHLVPRLFRRRASDQARTEGTSAPAAERDRRREPERRDQRQPAPAGVRERRRAAWPRSTSATPAEPS